VICEKKRRKNTKNIMHITIPQAPLKHKGEYVDIT
jgi:hypothetical protein